MTWARVLAVAWPLAWAAASSAETVQPPTISSPDAWVARQSATLRVLNKIDSTVRSVTIPVGGTATVQSLSIRLQACAVRPDDLPQDAAARLSVSESAGDAPAFDGWILQNEPAANMFEHPVYDIQLAACS